MKKGMIIFLAVMICALASGCASTRLPDCFDGETVKQMAKEAIKLAESDNYEEFIKLFEINTAALLTKEIYQDQFLYTVAKKGDFENFGSEALVGQTDQETGASYAGVVIVAEYEKGKIQYTLGYNEDMKLIQFLIK